MDFHDWSYFNSRKIEREREGREGRESDQEVSFLQKVGRMMFFILLLYFTVKFLLGGWISFLLILAITSIFAAMVFSSEQTNQQ